MAFLKIPCLLLLLLAVVVVAQGSHQRKARPDSTNKRFIGSHHLVLKREDANTDDEKDEEGDDKEGEDKEEKEDEDNDKEGEDNEDKEDEDKEDKEDEDKKDNEDEDKDEKEGDEDKEGKEGKDEEKEQEGDEDNDDNKDDADKEGKEGEDEEKEQDGDDEEKDEEDGKEGKMEEKEEKDRIHAVAAISWSQKGGKTVFELNGSNSTGDIKSYLWTLLTTDHAGYTVQLPKATVSLAFGGVFEWELRVCDETYNCSTAVVKSPNLRKPAASVSGPHVVGVLNVSKIRHEYLMVLDGSESTGDNRINSYKWTLLEGDKVGEEFYASVVEYSTRKKGHYKWSLTVCDLEQMCSSGTVEVDL